MESKGLHVALAAERLGTFFGVPITNTLVAAWTVMVVLIVTAFIIGRAPRMLPTRVQNVFEMLFEFVLEFMERTLGSRELALRYFPLIATIFLFIFTSNLFDFLPFFGSVGLYQGGELVPLYRPVNTDLNVTLALAVISVFAIEAAGIAALGLFGYLKQILYLPRPLDRRAVPQFLCGDTRAGERSVAPGVFFVPPLRQRVRRRGVAGRYRAVRAVRRAGAADGL